MQRQRSRLLLFSMIACAVSTFLAAWMIFAQQPRQPDPNALRNAGQSGEWRTYGGDYAETRYSPLRQIDASNANRLGLAWTQVVGAGGGNQEATPLFWNGALYGITNWSIAFAMDARTGRELWRFDPEVPRSYAAQGENRGVCCGILNRGIALYEGKVIVPVLDGRLIAVDAATGKVLHRIQTQQPVGGGVVTYQAGGKQYVGVAAGLTDAIMQSKGQPTVIILGL